ncbi:tetratricopeptide repeat-containing protein [Besnoitia besnoiti]|uniref:Tetratricopeptide repeat-containing protein n=1 Tax=Besnoitia besnoiti TaxID=94643 RepID=A0A2A9MD38_BESBE|nr:tetratricopeptide repeat-containing protein [Besnoitia besnoiti]PFH34211.1 tetratricopeptide repeat-containing protein [Besnoitia besnoiti]
MAQETDKLPAPVAAAAAEEANEGARKVAQAAKEKEEGNELFKKGQVPEAIEVWRHALKLCYELSVSGDAPNLGEMYDLQTALENNLAAGLLKEGSYSRCLDHCDNVLRHDPQNEKALLRMAKAHIELQEYAQAEETIRRLREARPDNAEAASLQRRVLEVQKEHRRQEKVLYQSMLSRKGRESHSLSGSEKHESAPAQPSQWMWSVEFQPVDRDATVWRAPHSLESLTEECNFPLTRGLPLTILYALQAADEARKAALTRQAQTRLSAQSGGAQRGGDGGATAVAAPSPSGQTAATAEADCWNWRSIRRDVLCVHLIGVTSAHEMGCKFTVLLERWPEVKTLILVFIGFLGSHGKLEKELERGKLQPPAVVRTEDGREQLAVPFKGTYEEFVQAVPGVLTNPECTFFPDFAVLSTPLFSRDVDSWKPALALLLDSDVLSIATVSGPLRESVGAESREDEEVVKNVGGRIVVPTTKNEFPIILRVPKEALKNRQGTSRDDNPTEFIGNEFAEDEEAAKAASTSEILGAKHAAFFVFRGRAK